MKKSLMLCLALGTAVLAGGCSEGEVDEPMVGPSPAQLAAAQQVGLPVEITNAIGMKLMLIPAGEFLMGNAESAEETARAVTGGQAKWFQDEHPQHRVRLTKPFHLSAHEVTQEQYERVMGENPSHFNVPQGPVESLSWDDAVKFCDALSTLPEEQAAGRTYRMPTEAEWEYACRAGSTDRDSHADDEAALEDRAWFITHGKTHPVGQKRPNAWGLYDMHGNVFEWCSDWYGEDYYANSPQDDPLGPATGSLRVHRGGSWLNSATLCQSARRSMNSPVNRHSYLGFRVAAVVSVSPVSAGTLSPDDRP